MEIDIDKILSDAEKKYEKYRELYEQTENAESNKELLYAYRESQKDFRDLNSVIETTKNKGIKKGLVEGREQGRAEGREEGIKKGEKKGFIMTTKKMKEGGLSIALIANMTGLSEEEVSKL